jgi:hypothetical protein
MRDSEKSKLWDTYTDGVLNENTKQEFKKKADSKPKDGKISKYEKKVADKIAKSNDDESDDEHICALEVEHRVFGKGTPIFSEHAQPVDGYVSWYNVAFKHGNEVVNTKDVEVLDESSHGDH